MPISIFITEGQGKIIKKEEIREETEKDVFFFDKGLVNVYIILQVGNKSQLILMSLISNISTPNPFSSVVIYCADMEKDHRRGFKGFHGEALQ